MAGCKPEHVPFVIAAIEAMLEDRFNLNGVQTTTHSCAPLVVVSGPAAKRMGFVTKEGAFGHGCRASAAIGRAVRLILWNGGGGYPGEPCKTAHGHPGYYSFCVAEDSETNPWEPLNVEYGFDPDETIVTITATTGPHTIGTGAGYSSADDVLFVLSDSLTAIGSPNYSGGDMVLALGQLTARNLAQAGLSKADVKAELIKRSTRTVRDLRRRRSIAESHPMHWSHLVDPSDDDARAPFIRSPENLVLFVTGGLGSGGATSSLCPGWGPPGGFTVKRAVRFPDA
jgi:hypothetical protein